MNISAISAHAPFNHGIGRPGQVGRVAAEAQSPAVDSAKADDDSAGRKSGVLRLLQEGHFKGVAELRHRIRFHEQLSAEATAAAAQTLAEGTDGLVGVVREGVESLAAALESEQADPSVGMDGESDAEETTDAAPTNASLLGDFATSVETALTAGDDGTLDLDAVESELQSSFEALVASLRSLYETPEEPIDAADEISTLDEEIASLTASFEEALAALLAEADEAWALPDPQPAPGNGVAFDKFLAIYNARRGMAPPTIDATA